MLLEFSIGDGAHAGAAGEAGGKLLLPGFGFGAVGIDEFKPQAMLRFIVCFFIDDGAIDGGENFLRFYFDQQPVHPHADGRKFHRLHAFIGLGLGDHGGERNHDFRTDGIFPIQDEFAILHENGEGGSTEGDFSVFLVFGKFGLIINGEYPGFGIEIIIPGAAKIPVVFSRVDTVASFMFRADAISWIFMP